MPHFVALKHIFIASIKITHRSKEDKECKILLDFHAYAGMQVKSIAAHYQGLVIVTI